nr:MAG TPA: hypothetical protein [Caudoviricetes sp.]
MPSWRQSRRSSISRGAPSRLGRMPLLGPRRFR